MRYEDASGAFQASGPVANDDSDTLAAGSRGPATGNLITGEGTQYGSSGADSAAGGHITSIAGKGGEDSSFAGGKLSVAGEFGQLSVDAEGNYTYMANKGAPENVRDRFTYTLADSQGNSDTAALVVEIGKTPVVIKADAQQIVPGPDGVVTLPPGVELSDIMVVGRNLVINMPDGTQLIIVDGAVFVPQLVLGGVEVPASNVAALLIGQEPQPAAGETPPSSGGNFALPPPPLDPGVPLGDLLPPTEYNYTPPEPQETFLPEDEEPEILIQPEDQQPSVAAVDQVEEAGLPERDGDLLDEPAGSAESADGNGADNDVNSEATTGTIIINSPDGVGSVTINGVEVTGVVGQQFAGAFGTLTVEGFDGDNILYSYLLHDNTSGNDTHDDFSVVLTDSDGDVASATLRIDIIDDVPTARPDTDTVGEGENPFLATGNVMTDAAPGDAGDSDTNAADTVGADNARVTFIDSVNAAPGANVPNGSFVDIAGQYGMLRIYSNGDYEYTRGQDTPGGVQDVFNYTLTDGDGDTSVTTLTINIPDRQPDLPDPPAVLLDDDALANGNPGGTDDDVDSQGTPGQLVGSGGDGDLDYAFGGPNTLPAGFTTNLVNASTMQILQGGTVVLTVTLNNDTGAYSVVQNNPIDHPAGSNENNLSFGLGVQVVDADNDVEGATLTINVDDDTPVLGEVVSAGDVTLDESDAGSPAGFPISDTSLVPVIDFTAAFGADGAAAVNATVFGLAITGGPGSGLQTAVGDFPITLVQIDGDTIQGQYNGSNVAFIIQMNANGTVTLTQNVALEHLVDGPPGPDHNDALDLGGLIAATVTITDGDGDTDSEQVAIGDRLVFLDDGPSVTENQVTGLVDEDGVVEGVADGGEGDGIAGGVGDVPGAPTVASGSVAAMFNSGADAPLSYGFAANAVAVLEALGLSSNGVALDYAIVGNTVTASTAAGDVFTFELNADGSWEFTLIDQLDHAEGNNENDLAINLGAIVQATDADGDFVVGSADGLVITVDDDTPTASGNQVTGLVDEDGVVEGAPDGGEGDGIPGGVGDVPGAPTVASGSVSAMFNSGADAPLSYGFAANALAVLEALGLTSGGVALDYAIVGDTVTASTAAGDVFTFELNANGSWEFTLIDQLDHPTLNGQPGDDTENDLQIQLGAIIQATDADGDSVVGNANGLVITVDDDTPAEVGEPSTIFVDEDALAGGNPGGPNDGPGTGLSGSIFLSSQFASGADEPLSYGMSTNTSGLPALTSNGVAIQYQVVGNVLTASAGGNPVFTVTLNPVTGEVTFALIDQIDHPTLNGQAGDNTENNLQIDLSSLFTATDADGDSLSLGAGSVIVDVDDDTPIALEAQVTGLVDEDGVVEGAADGGVGDGIAGGTGDVPGAPTVANGSVLTLFSAGADQPLSFGFPANAITVLEGLGLTSNGEALDYAIVGNTVTASTSAGDVFTFQLQANGNWTFTLIDQLDHAPGNNENDLTINLGSIVQATDADGDSVTAFAGGLVITVDDDTPTASGNQVTGLVDEDGVVEAGTVGDGIPGGVGDVPGSDTVATGSVSTMFNTGADAPLSFGFAANAVAVLNALGLTSNGLALNYVVNGDTVTASTAAGDVFTFELNANGNWEFTLIDQLDHAAGNNENDLQIQLGAIIQATDADGDSVVGNANGLVITVDDDTPVATNDVDLIVGGVGPATGNVMTGVEVAVPEDGNATDGNADSTGADAPTRITFIDHSNGAPGAVVPNGGSVVIAGDHGNLTIYSNGDYSYTRTDNVGGVQDVFTYTLTDADGDNVTATLTISIEDNFPQAGSVNVQLDDETLAGGIAGGTGDVNPDLVNVSGNLPGSGGDGALTWSLLTTNPPAGFSYVGGGASVQVFQGAVHVATINITNAATGAYTVTQVAPIDHPDGLNENNVQFTVNYRVTDADNDFADGTINVDIDDDSPTVSANLAAQLDDDALAGGNPGGTGDVNPDTANLSGTLGHAYGADGAGSTVFLTTGAPAGFTYELSGSNLLIKQGATTVITVTLNTTTGAYTVTQNAPIAHAPGGDENDVSFTLNYRVSDSDNDTVDGTLVINVDDDTPTVSANAAVQLDDETLAGGIAGGTGDVNPNTANTSGTLAHSYGADGAGSTAFLTTGAPAGFTYELSGSNLLIKQGATTVITVTLNNNTGAYTVTQNAPIQHAPGGDENDVAFTLNYRVTDGDGDTVDGTIVINSDDDTPTASTAQLTGTVDEDGVLEGAADGGPGDGIAGGTGDFAGEPVTASGSVTTLFNSGADQPLTYQMLNNFAGLNAQSLTSNGVALTYGVVLNAGVYTLTASAGAETVFTFTLNASTGAYTFTLVDQLDHPTLNGVAGDDTENDLPINLSSLIQATDNDGDSVAAGANALVITVDDDSPTLGTIQDQVASNVASDPVSIGTLHFEVGADAPAAVIGITADNTGITSGGKGLVTNVVGNVLTAYQDANSSGTYDAGDTVAVYTLTVNPNAGTSGQYVFDLITPLDPTVTDVPIGGSSSFGAGPNVQGQILESATGTDLSVISGYNTNGSFNFATWFGGTLNSAHIAAGGINGSTTGWGVDDNNFDDPNELFFFDFGAQPLSDPDGAGGTPATNYAPPAGVTLPNISTATFDFINYNPGAGNAGDDIAYVVHFTDGTSTNGWIPAFALDGSSHADATNWKFTAPAGKFIADVQFFSGMEPDGVTPQNLAPGKVDLVSVGVQESDLDETIHFGVTIQDADGDKVTGSFDVNVTDGGAPVTPESLALTQTSSFSSSFSNLSYENDNQKWHGNGNDKNFSLNNTGIVAGIVAAAGLQSVGAAASPSIEQSFDLDLQGLSHTILPQYSLQQIDDGALGVQSFGVEQSEPAFDLSALQGSGHGFNDFVSNGGLDVQAYGDAVPAYEPSFALDQAPAYDASMLVAVAPTVGMPSAEALIAAGLVGNAQHGGAVEQIVAEALGNAAPTVDALLEAVNGNGQQAILEALSNVPDGGAGGDMSAILNGTSGLGVGVSSWDMSSHGAFGATADMMFKMDVASFHHDAVQPVVNG